LSASVYLFGTIVGAQMPQNSLIKLFSGCFEPFLLEEWAYRFGKGLILKLRHWTTSPAYLSASVYLFGTIVGAQMPQNRKKNCFLVLYHFSYRPNRPIDLVRGLFTS
jgi:hypothetical protein